jgi:hypothetical protein
MYDNFDDIHDAPLIDKSWKPLYMKAWGKIFSLIFSYWLTWMPWIVYQKTISHRS